MSFKSLTLILSIAVLNAPLFALTSADYLASGRDSLFSGTISGIQQAHATFEQALSDATCSDCQNNREILFFHALSRIGMWAVRQDGAPVDSLLEACEAFEAPVIGDVIRDLTFTEPDIAEDRYGRPVLPRSSEQMLADLLSFIDAAALPELDATIAQLEQITETPDNRFRVFLTPLETAVFVDLGEPLYTSDVEVDYADVMMLKGILYMVKGFITAQSAWDLNVSDPEALYFRLWENCLSIENDILLPNPDFLKLLPTASDPSDGAAILLQARQDILTALQYYLDMISYIQNEDTPAGTDPQEDELFSINPADNYTVNQVVEYITTFRDSLVNDKPMTEYGEKEMFYSLYNEQSRSAGLCINMRPLRNEMKCTVAFQHTEEFELGEIGVRYISQTDYCECEFDLDVQGSEFYGSYTGQLSTSQFIGLSIKGMFNEDRSQISNCSIHYWGDIDGSIVNLQGSCYDEWPMKPFTMDANPALGGSLRYPQPVSPRGLLFDFDQWNKPISGTLPDPTLGGILPETIDTDWTRWINAQPEGSIDWPIMQPWQMHNPSFANLWPAFWLDEQCVFTDATGEPDFRERSFDISKLYLGVDWHALYGSIVMASDFSPHEPTVLRIFLSHSPEEEEAAGTLLFEITAGDESSYGTVYYRVEDGGMWWAECGFFEVLPFADQVDFRIPLDMFPAGLAGRFLTIESGCRDPYSWSINSMDENCTHLQLGSTGTVSGTVTFDGWLGGPIIVQAFDDLDEPEGSLLAYTVLDAPGEYTLGGIGVGWNGYIRAISPLFGPYHPFDMDAIKAECIVPVSLRTQTVSGVDLDLQVPTVLPHVYSYTHSDSLNTTTNRRDVYAFDAIAGVYYQLVLNCEFSARIILMDRNGSDPLVEPQSWQAQNIWWLCPVNGRYYVEISEDSWWRSGGTYGLSFGTGWYCPETDISSARWSGVKDCRVDLSDFALLAGQWLSDCGDPYWCQESDYDHSGEVDFKDFMELINEWLNEGGMTV